MTADAERLAAIRERLEAATPGPWVLGRRGYTVMAPVAPSPLVGESRPTFRAEIDGPNWQSNAQVVAHAPEDIAYLLTVAAERDALRARIEAVSADVAHVDEATNGYVLAAAITARLAGADDDGVDRAIRQAHEDLAGDQPEATPEPPHLDPKPWVSQLNGKGYEVEGAPDLQRRFDPRPADKNGKAYSQKREDYP